MPTAYIQKLADEGKGSVAELESKWNKAKSAAKDEGKGDNFAYITSIFKNMVGASAGAAMPVGAGLGAAKRLLAHHKMHAGRATGLGAGATIMSRKTGRILLGLRSNGCESPGTWCNFGGGVEEGETPEQGCMREIWEEAGYDGPMELVHMHESKQPDFTYHNFVGLVDDEFEPVLNDEHTEYQWADPDAMPEPLHPEYQKALEQEQSRHLMQRLRAEECELLGE